MGETGDRRALETAAFRAGMALAATLTDEDLAIVAGWSIAEARHVMRDGFRDGDAMAQALDSDDLDVIRRSALRCAEANARPSGPSEA